MATWERRRRRAWRALACSGVVVALGWVWAGPAGAQVEGPCQATIAGQDVSTAARPGDAIEVDVDDQVEVTATSSGSPLDTYEVELEFAGFAWGVADGEADGQTWSDVVDVSDYADFSVGLYKVRGVSFAGGSEICTGTAYIKVGGKNPLLPAAGAVGAVSLLGGAALMVWAGVRP